MPVSSRVFNSFVDTGTVIIHSFWQWVVNTFCELPANWFFHHFYHDPCLQDTSTQDSFASFLFCFCCCCCLSVCVYVCLLGECNTTSFFYGWMKDEMGHEKHCAFYVVNQPGIHAYCKDNWTECLTGLNSRGGFKLESGGGVLASSQRLPVKSEVHTQKKVDLPSIHVAPFWHGSTGVQKKGLTEGGAEIKRVEWAK